MTCYYKLQINLEPSIDIFDQLTKILGVLPNDNIDDFADTIPSNWSYEIIEGESDPFFDFINIFLDLLEPTYSKLEALGIPY
jgi:hypothetical protein